MAISLRESITVGFSDFWSRKIRSLVTIVGIILGTMSIIVVLALMKGINEQTIAWMMERGGLSKISVYRNWTYDNPLNLNTNFTWREIDLIRSLIPEAKYFSAQERSWAQFKYRAKDYRSSVWGVTPDFTKIEEWDVESGRFINEFDMRQANDVIVIGTEIRSELFGSKDPIGEFISLQNRRLQVIGVMRHRYLKNNNMIGGENSLAYLNRRAYIPISTMIHKGSGEDAIGGFTVKAADVESTPELKEKLESIILNLRMGKPVFRVESAQEEAEKMAESQKSFQTIFFLISTISLFVGGIVIANIMLATIQERTREIGIRITVGARRRDIFLQFLVQTVLVTLIGGIMGVIFGLSILDVVSRFIKIDLIAGIEMIIIALVVSAGVGLLAGIIPAIVASKLNPVEALRYE